MPLQLKQRSHPSQFHCENNGSIKMQVAKLWGARGWEGFPPRAAWHGVSSTCQGQQHYKMSRKGTTNETPPSLHHKFIFWSMWIRLERMCYPSVPKACHTLCGYKLHVLSFSIAQLVHCTRVHSWCHSCGCFVIFILGSWNITLSNLNWYIL